MDPGAFFYSKCLLCIIRDIFFAPSSFAHYVRVVHVAYEASRFALLKYVAVHDIYIVYNLSPSPVRAMECNA
jgi:hypothetical protein